MLKKIISKMLKLLKFYLKVHIHGLSTAGGQSHSSLNQGDFASIIENFSNYFLWSINTVYVINLFDTVAFHPNFSNRGNFVRRIICQQSEYYLFSSLHAVYTEHRQWGTSLVISFDCELKLSRHGQPSQPRTWI